MRSPDEEREAADQILLAAKRISYKPGDQILRRGCTARNLYHLVYGSVACITANGQVRAAEGTLLALFTLLAEMACLTG